MLTKIDLNQIRNLVHEEINTELNPIKKELSQIGQVIDEKLDKKLKPIKKDLQYLKKTANLIIKNYDEEDIKLARRVRKIEEHIGLTA